jgi:hypothetical protein
MYGDGAGRAGYARTDSAGITVDRDGTRIGQTPQLYGAFEVPAGAGRYRVAVDATRGAPFALSTRDSVVWTFRSGHVDGTAPVVLPLSAIRFKPKLDLRNTAPANPLLVIPVEVQRQPGSAAARIATLAVEVSVDDGKTWKRAIVLRNAGGGVALAQRPQGSGFVSLRAASADTDGNTVEQTIIRAYRY